MPEALPLPGSEEALRAGQRRLHRACRRDATLAVALMGAEWVIARQRAVQDAAMQAAALLDAASREIQLPAPPAPTWRTP